MTAPNYTAPSVDQEAFLIARNLPSGRVWNSKYDSTRVLGRLIAALAEESRRLFLRIENFVNVELDPNQTRQLILDWEESAGIPDVCFDRSASLIERRRRVIQKLNDFGGVITNADIVAVLADFGETVQLVPGNETNADRLGFGSGPYNATELRQIRHTLAVRVESDATTFALPFPIEFATEQAGLLQCLMQRLVPAHVSIQFFFNENLALPFQ